VKWLQCRKKTPLAFDGEKDVLEKEKVESGHGRALVSVTVPWQFLSERW
jgi:hypothetical protein